jgi:hypothetical protein
LFIIRFSIFQVIGVKNIEMPIVLLKQGNDLSFGISPGQGNTERAPNLKTRTSENMSEL